MNKSSPLLKQLIKRSIHPWLLIALGLWGCASPGPENTLSEKCSVSDSLINRNGTPGVQFVNSCGECIAVAFEYRQQRSNSKWTACYVPSNSKVVFWDADEYWLITHKPCIEVRKNGLGGISVAEIESNDQYGRCDSRGTNTN